MMCKMIFEGGKLDKREFRVPGRGDKSGERSEPFTSYAIARAIGGIENVPGFVSDRPGGETTVDFCERLSSLLGKHITKGISWG
jgi:hypothetical protein